LVARDQRLAGEPVAGAAIELERRAKLAADLLGTKRELEANLNKVRNQLVHAERLATVGNIAGGVGHELEVISLVLELELEALATIRGVRESTAFTELSRAISVIKTHAGGLLAMARPGPDFTAPEDLCEVFRSVIRTLRISGKLTDVAVTTDFEEEPVMVSVNRTRIEQILINLMLNAIDSFEPPSQSPTIHLSIALIPHSQRIACRVEDNGCGIVSDDIDRIFDSYFSTKFESGHMGMGLVVARQIVESYGGTLMVSSRADSGTSFSFDLLRAVQDDEPLD
jgi:C4-dicarboxylate-specific signal transduction histidine kinase